MFKTAEDPGGRSVTIAQIEHGCRDYESESAVLEKMLAALEADLTNVKAMHIAGIKRQAGVVANREAALHSLVERAPELFEKPRTLTLHGVKVGYTLSNGRVEFLDEATVIALIKKLRKDDAAVLIRTTEEVNKDGLRNLSQADLAKLGCAIAGAGDLVLVKRTAGEVEKLINKLIAKMVEAIVTTE